MGRERRMDCRSDLLFQGALGFWRRRRGRCRLRRHRLRCLLARFGVRFARGHDLGQPGEKPGHAVLQVPVIGITCRVNLSERVAPSARLQNRACDFRRTRLLNVFCFVMQHGTRDSLVTVSVEQLEVGLLVVPVVTVHMMHL